MPNIQGRQYKVLIVSIVTDMSCLMDSIKDKSKQFNDLGFLSDRKLLCTALTRATSLVLVVGDPAVLLVHQGLQCYDVWQSFLELTTTKGSFSGEDPQYALERVTSQRELITAILSKMQNQQRPGQSTTDQQQRQVVQKMSNINFAG